jgi:hypothetical protein
LLNRARSGTLFSMGVLDEYKGKAERKAEAKEVKRIPRAVTKPLSEVNKKPWTGEGVKRGPNGRDWAKGTAPGPGRPAGIVAHVKARTNGLLDLIDRLIDAAMTGYFEMHDPNGETLYAQLEPREIIAAMAEVFNRGGWPKQTEKLVDIQKTVTVGVEERRQRFQALTPEKRAQWLEFRRMGLVPSLAEDSGNTPANVVDGEVIP